MQSPVDAHIAETNRVQRAVQSAMAPPPRPPLPDRALIGERLADHGDDSGRQARTKMADGLDTLCKQVSIIRKNPTLNGAQIELSVADMVRGNVDHLLSECDEQAKLIELAQRAVEDGIEAALTPPRSEWHALGAEYRAVLRAMKPEQRTPFVNRMEGTRHMAALRYAIAGVPPELSGISLETHYKLLNTLLALKDPTLLTRPNDLVKRRAALATAVDGIRRTAAELVDFEKADAIKALAGGNVP
jgi:hypothetical protein